ncbi:hypothetical protein BSKO_10719 [Bryopsis sp. KO-2023]|nr:hypothetical protein BSKO_10719 [Bryopsis sp. KO-2023]
MGSVLDREMNDKGCSADAADASRGRFTTKADMVDFRRLVWVALVPILYLQAVQPLRCREAPLRYTIPEKYFKLWSVPRNATIVMEYTSSCGKDAPASAKPRLELDCHFSRQLFRECLRSTEPTFVGRHCKGQTCTLSFPRSDSSCFFKATGHTIKPHDKNLAESCGVEGLRDLNRQEPLHKSNPFADEFSRDCDEPLPPGVFGLTWTLCTEKGVQAKVELKFQASMPEESEYTCLLRSECEGGYFTRQALCYAENLVGNDTLKPMPDHRVVGCHDRPTKHPHDLLSMSVLRAPNGVISRKPTSFMLLCLALAICIFECTVFY